MPRFTAAAALAALLLVVLGLLIGPAAATEHLSLGVSPHDEFSTSGQPMPAFGTASKSVGQTFKTPDRKSTELTAFAFYMSRAKPAPRFVVPEVYMWDAVKRAVKGPAVFRGEPVELSAAEDRDNAAIVVETGGVNLKPDTPYIAVFTTLNAGNSGLWSPLTSINVQLVDTGYGEGQFLVSDADTLDGPVWTDVNGRSLTFWMSFEQPIGALTNGVTVTTKTPQIMVKPGQSRAFTLTVTNSGTSVISNAALVVTALPGVTLLRASVAPKDKGTGFGAPATSWTQPVNLDVGKSRIYTFKVRVDRCASAGDLVLTTAVGAVTGPSVTLKVGAAKKKWGC